MFKPCPPGLRPKAGGWLMTMDSISLSDFMCLHCRLATVLTSSFNRNHWIVRLCSAYVCVCMVLEKILPILINWLKTTVLLHFTLCPLFFPHHSSSPLWTVAVCHDPFYQDFQIYLPLEIQESSSFYSVPHITWMKK